MPRERQVHDDKHDAYDGDNMVKMVTMMTTKMMVVTIINMMIIVIAKAQSPRSCSRLLQESNSTPQRPLRAPITLYT